MKKFLIALLAALLVVSMATVAFATEAGTSGPTGSEGADKGSEPISGSTTTTTECDGVNHNYKTITYGATCEANATTILRCSCGAEIRTETANTALGHDWDETKTKVLVAGDCLTDGKAIKTCKRCGATKEVTIAGGHKWTEYTTVTPATCVTNGMKKRQCTACGLVEAAQINATGKHLFADKYVMKKADCDHWGTYEAQCTMCGKYFHYEDLGDDDATAIADGTIVLKIKKRGHNMGPSVVITAPTCMTDGVIEAVCQNTTSTPEYLACGKKVVTTIPASTTAYNPAVQEVTKKYHKLVFVTEVAATKTTKAIGYYKCTVTGCGYKSKEVVEYSGDANAIAKTVASSASNTSSATKPAAKPASSSTNKKGVSIPKTNDTTSNLPYVLIAVAFVGLVALVASKKKVNG